MSLLSSTKAKVIFFTVWVLFGAYVLLSPPEQGAYALAVMLTLLITVIVLVLLAAKSIWVWIAIACMIMGVYGFRLALFESNPNGYLLMIVGVIGCVISLPRVPKRWSLPIRYNSRPIEKSDDDDDPDPEGIL
jgi:hypothetical protein